MKFEEAKVGMKVSDKGMTGTIVEVDKSDKSVLISFGNDTSLWFWDIDHSNFPLKDIEVMSTDVKVPKFDIDLADSKEFQDYFKSVIAKYTKEPLPNGTHITDVSIYKDGKTVVKDNKGNTGISKCHPDDAFNLDIGMKLAIERLSKKGPFIPKSGEQYWKVFSTKGNIIDMIYNKGFFEQEIDIAIGNCFRTEEEAEKHKDKVIDKFKNILDLVNIMTVDDKV